MRPTRACRFCGYAYKGRGILSDHGFAEYNLEQHEAVCLEQQEKRARARRRRMRRLAKAGKPLPGQLGFPFDDVPEEVE